MWYIARFCLSQLVQRGSGICVDICPSYRVLPHAGDFVSWIRLEKHFISSLNGNRNERRRLRHFDSDVFRMGLTARVGSSGQDVYELLRRSSSGARFTNWSKVWVTPATFWLFFLISCWFLTVSKRYICVVAVPSPCYDCYRHAYSELIEAVDVRWGLFNRISPPRQTLTMLNSPWHSNSNVMALPGHCNGIGNHTGNCLIDRLNSA